MTVAELMNTLAQASTPAASVHVLVEDAAGRMEVVNVSRVDLAAGRVVIHALTENTT